jgi:hypothetical protein
MKTNLHLRLYLPHFFSEWEMFQTKVVHKIKTHILCSVPFTWKSCLLWDKMGKYGRHGRATDENIVRRVHFAVWITKATDTRSEYLILTVLNSNSGYANTPYYTLTRSNTH